MPRKRGRCHVALHADSHPDALRLDVAKRLGHRQRVRKIQAKASIFDRLVDPQQSQRTHFAKERVRRKYFGGLPFVDMGIDLLGHESTDRVHHASMFVCVQHAVSLLTRTVRRELWC